MGETIEKRLKDYKGYQVWKITDNKGTRNETITYMLNDQDDDNINCFTTLAELKNMQIHYKSPEESLKIKTRLPQKG